MIAISRYFVLLTIIFSVQGLYGQGLSVSDTLIVPGGFKPDIRRVRNHDLVDAAQQAILSSDGKKDKLFTPSENEDVNFLLTKVLVQKVDNIQYMIEADANLDHRLKVNYLHGLESLLKYFNDNWKAKTEKKINPVHLPLILNAYERSMQKDLDGGSIEEEVSRLPYDAGTTLLNADIFNKNPGYQPAKNHLVLKYCVMYPEKTFYMLSKNPDMPFADSLIKVVAPRYVKQLYDYASASNKLANIIRNINDDKLIKTVARMANSRSGQQYFPFLDNLLRDKLTFADIDKAKDDSVKYYKLLVRTRMDYAKRLLDKDTAFEFSTLTERLERKGKENFVNIINGLHDIRNPDIRFRNIQSLSAEELYYLAVFSDGAIYTSSFVKGIYPLMMSKINNRGDSLLMSLNFDRYRKFIKMCAAFNTLDNFLSSFPKAAKPGEEDPAHTLMRAFVRNLEKSGGLEDGVDVADSYASVAETLKPVADEMLKNIQDNYRRCVEQDNKKGIAIYNILNKLFLSADSSAHINLTKELGIPPIYEVPFSALAGDNTGRVIVQLFIYGDKDGIGVFPGLVNMFNNANWKIDGSNKQWVAVSSAKGSPVTLYMNRPLPEENGEDAKAQEALCRYLEENKLVPAVTINRGHSYNAPYTIQQMSTASKIVFMGSCGGYNMIRDILIKAPDAHIIGTKQIADVPVNNPFLKLLTEKLRQGSNIEWIPFWKELGSIVTDKIFEDYVPPHKNLGALFIKAYKLAIGEDENKE